MYINAWEILFRIIAIRGFYLLGKLATKTSGKKPSFTYTVKNIVKLSGVEIFYPVLRP